MITYESLSILLLAIISWIVLIVSSSATIIWISVSLQISYVIFTLPSIFSFAFIKSCSKWLTACTDRLAPFMTILFVFVNFSGSSYLSSSWSILYSFCRLFSFFISLHCLLAPALALLLLTLIYQYLFLYPVLSNLLVFSFLSTFSLFRLCICLVIIAPFCSF